MMLVAVGSLGFIGQIALRASTVFPPAAPLAEIRSPAFFGQTFGRILFETNWLYWVATLILALVLLHFGFSRGNRRTGIAGLAVVAFLILWIAAASLIVTPAERLYAAHEAMAKAAEKGDVAGLLAWLSPDFQSTALGINDPANARDQLDRRLKEFGIKNVRLSNYRSNPRAARGPETEITVTVDASVQAPPTTWRLLWVDLPESDWRVSQAELLKVAGQDAPPNFVIGGS